MIIIVLFLIRAVVLCNSATWSRILLHKANVWHFMKPRALHMQVSVYVLHPHPC